MLSKHATLKELQEFYSVHDLYDFIEALDMKDAMMKYESDKANKKQ